MASPSGEELCNDGTEPGVNHFTKLILNNGRHSGRIAYEIDPALDRHEVDNGAVLRRERFNVSSAVPVRFSERVLCVLGREQAARLGKRDPAPLVRWQCRHGYPRFNRNGSERQYVFLEPSIGGFLASEHLLIIGIAREGIGFDIDPYGFHLTIL